MMAKCYYLVANKMRKVFSKTFVQPSVVPPVAGNEISKPHVYQFMGNCGQHISSV